ALNLVKHGCSRVNPVLRFTIFAFGACERSQSQTNHTKQRQFLHVHQYPGRQDAWDFCDGTILTAERAKAYRQGGVPGIRRDKKNAGLTVVTLNLHSQPRLPGSVVGEASMRQGREGGKITGVTVPR